MTLHWWMHWFWVTAQCTVIIAIPFSAVTEDLQVEPDSQLSWKTLAVRMTQNPEDIYTTREPPKASMRMPKAINAYQPSKKRNSVRLIDPPMFRLSTNPSRAIKNSQEILQFKSDNAFGSGRTPDTTVRRTTNFLNSQRGILSEETIEDDIRTGSQVFQRREDTKIIWISTTSRSPVQDNKKLNLEAEDEKSLTVLPLRLEEKIKLYVNRNITTGEIESDIISTRTFNGSSVQIDQELSEQRISSATAVPILHADLAESTRLSRARSSFASDYDRNLAQDRSFQENDIDDVVDGDSIIGGVSADTASGRPTAIYIAAITGSCLAMVIFISTIASLGFVMYRRKYLNPPQTLNSDKCSNPDSSGYIDDSTIRDNSEEMYSLDNDSFLNSLEAMTIQNYWTDSVKHTKL